MTTLDLKAHPPSPERNAAEALLQAAQQIQAVYANTETGREDQSLDLHLLNLQGLSLLTTAILRSKHLAKEAAIAGLRASNYQSELSKLVRDRAQQLQLSSDWIDEFCLIAEAIDEGAIVILDVCQNKKDARVFEDGLLEVVAILRMAIQRRDMRSRLPKINFQQS